MCALQFDRTQRYHTVREITARLGLADCHRVLDVGGGTGELQALLKHPNWLSVDPRGAGPNHISGTMTRLPLCDQSCDLVLQLDALEHIPGEQRLLALRELVRVSRQWIVWVGPVASPLATEVEQDLCELHQQRFGREMDWLVEHRQMGLPDRELVIATIADGCQDYVCWSSAQLLRWWLGKRLELELEASAYRPELEQALDDWYTTHGWLLDYAVDSENTPAYRLVVVGQRNGDLPEGLALPPAPCHDFSLWQSLLPVLAQVLEHSLLRPDGGPAQASLMGQLERIAGLLEQDRIQPEADRAPSWWERLKR